MDAAITTAMPSMSFGPLLMVEQGWSQLQSPLTQFSFIAWTTTTHRSCNHRLRGKEGDEPRSVACKNLGLSSLALRSVPRVPVVTQHLVDYARLRPVLSRL